MRYIPMSRYSIAEIEQQCRDAINRASVPAPCSWEEVNALEEDDFYAENAVLWGFAWEQDMLVPAAA